MVGLFGSFAGLTTVAETTVDSNITGFFDIVTALITQILSFLAHFYDDMDHGQ